MKITADRSTLLALVGRAAAAAAKDRNKPILCAVRLVAKNGHVTLTGMDLGHSVETTGACNVEEPGEEAIPADMLVSALKGIAADVVTLASGNKGRVKLSGRGVSYTLNSHDAADYPEAPPVDGARSFTVDGAAFAAALGCVRASVAPPDNKYGLAGIHVEESAGKLRLVATDGNRLAWAEVAVEGEIVAPRRAIVPGSAIPLLLSACDGGGPVTVSMADRACEVRTGTTTIRLRLLEADFPDYRQVIPTGWKRRILIDRDDFATAIKQVAVVDTGAVKMAVSADVVDLSTRSVDRGEAKAEVYADVTGEPVVIGMNSRFMLDALGAATGERVTLDLLDALGPMRVTGENAAACWIVMPVRLE